MVRVYLDPETGDPADSDAIASPSLSRPDSARNVGVIYTETSTPCDTGHMMASTSCPPFPMHDADTTADLSLDAVVRRLADRQVVNGVIIVGSAATGTLNACSDYDVLVVLSGASLTPECILTTVEGRNTEVFFITTETLDRIIAEVGTLQHASWLGGLADRIASGVIAFDRTKRLVQAQTAIRNALPLQPVNTSAIYVAWFETNYDLWQTKRMARSEDPVYRIAVDHRLLHGLSTLWSIYFLVRGFPWRGEKEAIRYLLREDPDYLAHFRQAVSDVVRDRKLTRYEELVRQTLQPVGPVWDDQVTVASCAGEPATLVDALRFWETLVSSLA